MMKNLIKKILREGDWDFIDDAEATPMEYYVEFLKSKGFVTDFITDDYGNWVLDLYKNRVITDKNNLSEYSEESFIYFDDTSVGKLGEVSFDKILLNITTKLTYHKHYDDEKVVFLEKLLAVTEEFML
jgi:hypothetical protein